MRLHRKRRREGTHYVRIPLESFEIEGLIRLKVLPKARREDADALQAAVLTLVYQALDRARPRQPNLRRALPRTHRTPSRIEELVTAVTRGALRDSAVSLLSPTQDIINDRRPPGGAL